uniref:Uncharacterized protein n=1 Tax=Acrobeloides nanus TaxID=290746 RepID=A0A914C331_9BILA
MAPIPRNKRLASKKEDSGDIPKKKACNSKSTNSVSFSSCSPLEKRGRGRFRHPSEKSSKDVKTCSSTANTTMVIQDTTIFNNNLPTEQDFTPEVLAHKLEDYCNILAQNKDIADCPDLKDFDIEHDTENLEKYIELREELCRKISHFDEEGKTEVNFATAAIAGAKLWLDEKKATRSISKKLAEEVGVSEDNLLYHGLNMRQEYKSVQEILEERTNSIVESFVDFQKQIKFKMNVLNHVAKKAQFDKTQSKSHPRTRQQQKEASPKKKKENEKKMSAPKTPKKQNKIIDPLAHSKIINEYALEVASEVVDHSRKPRKIAPIPIDFNIFDGVVEQN